jgi:hypothetical protein
MGSSTGRISRGKEKPEMVKNVQVKRSSDDIPPRMVIVFETG